MESSMEKNSLSEVKHKFRSEFFPPFFLNSNRRFRFPPPFLSSMEATSFFPANMISRHQLTRIDDRSGISFTRGVLVHGRSRKEEEEEKRKKAVGDRLGQSSPVVKRGNVTSSFFRPASTLRRCTAVFLRVSLVVPRCLVLALFFFLPPFHLSSRPHPKGLYCKDTTTHNVARP